MTSEVSSIALAYSQNTVIAGRQSRRSKNAGRWVVVPGTTTVRSACMDGRHKGRP